MPYLFGNMGYLLCIHLNMRCIGLKTEDVKQLELFVKTSANNR